MDGHRLPSACFFPVRHPLATLAALLLVAAALGVGVRDLTFDPSSEKVFPEGHPAVEAFQTFRETFGSDESVLVAYTLAEGDVFSREGLALDRELAAGLQAIDGIDRVVALSEVPALRLHPLTGLPVLGPGLPRDLEQATDEDLNGFRERVLRLPFVEGLLVSKDHRAACLVALIEPQAPGSEGAEANFALVRDVERLLARAERPGVGFHHAGTPVIKAEIVRAIQRDLLVFTGPLLGVAALAALLLLRSARGVLLVLGVLAVSALCVLGAMGHLGLPIDPMSSLVPTLILVIGVADSMHLLVEQRAQAGVLGPEATGADTVAEALRHVALPCFLTSVTTAIGFGSLVTSDIAPIGRFGLAAAASSLTAFAVSVTLIPACASLLAPPRGRAARPLRLDRLATRVARRPRLTAVVGLALAGAAGLGALRIVTSTDFLRFFPEDSRLLRDALTIQENFAGVAPCELIVEGPPGSARDPAVLRAVYAFERDLESDDLIDVALSVADVVAAADRLRGGPGEVPQDPAEVARIEQLMEQLTGGRLPLEQLYAAPGGEHPDREWLRISARAQAVGSHRFGTLLEEVEALEARHLRPLDLEVEATGTTVVFSQTAERIVWGQVESFLFAFGAITLVMILALRSLRLGLISVVPNLVPIAAIVGVMGYVGIPLNSFNSMVCSVAIGIAVDDTIHLLTGFQRFSRALPLRAAVQETVAHEGAAILSTSLVLFAGFSVLLLASFGPTMQFGLLTALAMGAALAGDLVLLPAILLLPGVAPRPSGAGAVGTTGAGEAAVQTGS